MAWSREAAWTFGWRSLGSWVPWRVAWRDRLREAWAVGPPMPGPGGLQRRREAEWRPPSAASGGWMVAAQVWWRSGKASLQHGFVRFLDCRAVILCGQRRLLLVTVAAHISHSTVAPANPFFLAWQPPHSGKWKDSVSFPSLKADRTLTKVTSRGVLAHPGFPLTKQPAGTPALRSNGSWGRRSSSTHLSRP